MRGVRVKGREEEYKGNKREKETDERKGNEGDDSLRRWEEYEGKGRGNGKEGRIGEYFCIKNMEIFPGRGKLVSCKFYVKRRLPFV